MALDLTAIPIGNPDDISSRALSSLQKAAVIVCEQIKEGERLLRRLKIVDKDLYELNEHTKPNDLKAIVELCRQHHVALITDCGTPGFCDPGADLVMLCRNQNIPVKVIPGASSLMVFLSGCGRRTDQFFFRGFLPANRELRESELRNLVKVKEPIILMDTPYRMTRLLEDLKTHFPSRKVILGHSLTTPQEEFLSGTANELIQKLGNQKLEFVLMLS